MIDRRNLTDDEKDRRKQVDYLLSDTFDSILRTEEKFLENQLTHGLTITEIHTIVAVGLDEENPMSVVAARLHITLATLTSAVAKLVKKGFVERTRCEADRRQVLIKLTKEGRKVYRAHGVFHRHLIDEALMGLNKDEEVVLASALKRINSFFEEQAAACAPQRKVSVQ